MLAVGARAPGVEDAVARHQKDPVARDRDALEVAVHGRIAEAESGDDLVALPVELEDLGTLVAVREEASGANRSRVR